jgi:hypothetical protein
MGIHDFVQHVIRPAVALCGIAVALMVMSAPSDAHEGDSAATVAAAAAGRARR